tara:strand:- start:22331 stop:23080 length:750 start_codon:yes stop_codon:yes gene_type:complete
MAQSKQITKDKFGIESYMAKILDKGVSTSNLYEFEILASVEMKRFMEANAKKKGNGDLYPKFTGDKIGQAQQRMNLLCQDIQIPGSTFNSVDVKMPKKGLTQKMAAAKLYNELDVTFICDLGSTPISFFKMWQDMTIGIQPGQASPEPIYSKDSRYTTLPHMAYAQRYYDDYTADVVINKLEKYGVTKPPKAQEGEEATPREDYHVPFKVRLVNAYPYSFSTVAYSAGPAQAVKCTVAFYYEYQQFMFN